jgi:hypothetical protein
LPEGERTEGDGERGDEGTSAEESGAADGDGDTGADREEAGVGSEEDDGRGEIEDDERLEEGVGEEVELMARQWR